MLLATCAIGWPDHSQGQTALARILTEVMQTLQVVLASATLADTDTADTGSNALYAYDPAELQGAMGCIPTA